LISVDSYTALGLALDGFVYNIEKRTLSGQKNKDYINSNKGASEIVMTELQQIFKK